MTKAAVRRLNAEIAAEIAHRYGLTLGDAVALRALSESAEEAEVLARMFATVRVAETSIL